MRQHVLAGLIGGLVASAPARGQDVVPTVAIHGFGGWTFGRTNTNNYLSGLPEGDFRHTDMALNLASRVNERLTIHVQGSAREDDDLTHLDLSFAFADYRVSDRFSFRIGQVKHPFGIYTEVFSVGTLRPFLDLPQGFYGPVGFAGQSYRGVGVTGVADLGEWGIAYDAYGGGTDIDKFVVPETYFRGGSLQNVSAEVEHESTRDVIGGRLVFNAPLKGFSFGGSSYTGILNEPAANRRTVVAGQIGYRSDQLTLESEVAYEDQKQDERATGGYVLVAYRVAPEWEVAVQYDRLDNTFFRADTSAAPSLQHHREGAFGLSRWLSRSFVIKAEIHSVSGNRFAMPHPEDLAAIITAGQLRQKTHLFQFGGQFTF